MYKIFITKEQFNSLKDNINFLNAIRLSRIVNAIRASQSFIHRSIKDNTSRGLRDKFEAIQYYGAVLFEGMKTFHSMKKQLEPLEEYKENISDINYLFKELENDNTFSKKILKRIRNKLVFHFDKDVFLKAISAMDLPSDTFIIIEGDSEKNIDTNAQSVTMLYFNYLISFIDKDISDIDKLTFIYEQIDMLSKKLLTVIENIIYGLLNSIAESEEK